MYKMIFQSESSIYSIDDTAMDKKEEAFAAIKWAKCDECGRPEVCKSNLWKLRGLLGAGVLGMGLLGLAALPLIGFGAGGVVAGSIAASWQSSIGIVTAGSFFAILQSLGATGLGSLIFGSIGTGIGLLSTLAVKLDWCDAKKASLRILKITNNSTDVRRTTLKLRVAHIQNLASPLTQQFKQADITWNVGVNTFLSESEKFLSIDLNGDKTFTIDTMMVWLLTADDQVKNVQRVNNQIAVANESVCINQIISWNELLRPENDFVKDGSVMLELEMTIIGSF